MWHSRASAPWPRPGRVCPRQRRLRQLLRDNESDTGSQCGKHADGHCVIGFYDISCGEAPSPARPLPSSARSVSLLHRAANDNGQIVCNLG